MTKNKIAEVVLRTVEVQHVLDKAGKEVGAKAKEKLERIRKYRQEASRLASMANKRLKRLEDKGLTDSPAYQNWLQEGGKKFSIRGKDFNQVQKEVARMRRFINSQTSTIRGCNKVLKEMAEQTGIKYKNLNDLRQKSKVFFELASKIEQYLRTVHDMASAIGYQKIWESINTYVQSYKIDLASAGDKVDDLVHRIIDAMDVYDEREKISAEWEGFGVEGWFQLDKDN